MSLPGEISMEWDSSLYDKKHDFVPEYGKGLFDFIPKDKAQSILDLGCGTGSLTAQLADFCGRVVGVDSSRSMIEKAKERFECIEFRVCDALALPFEAEFDIVFSNAVFHWIHDHHVLLKNIRKVLKSRGLLVAEFGAHGNIAAIENAFAEAYRGLGCSYQPKFNFPTVEAFGEALEKNGFFIDEINDYDRPTVLKDNEQGLTDWIKQFFASELALIPAHLQLSLFEQVAELTRESLWNGREWVADYRRLRVIAHT
ncbi:MAG: class I SAM-dependent methyltransferase [Akkermansia sp.]